MPIFLVARRLFRRCGSYRELALVALAAVIVLVGAVLFSLTNSVSYGVALYWAITTATTVGYCDVTPHNTAGRVIAAGVMLTTIPIVGAVFALIAGASAVSRIRRILGLDSHLPTQPYTLVYGTHPIVPRVLQELVATGDPVVLVAPNLPARAPERVELLRGHAADDGVVFKSKPAQASRALIACIEDADTLIVAVAIRALAPDLEVYALTQAPRVASALLELGVTHTLSSDELVGHMVAKSLETPEAGHMLLQLLDSTTYRLAEQEVDAALVSRPLSEARATAGSLVLGIARKGSVDLGVGEDPVLAAGDKLLVVDKVAKK
jgi:voltage-gated potassium channel